MIATKPERGSSQCWCPIGQMTQQRHCGRQQREMEQSLLRARRQNQRREQAAADAGSVEQAGPNAAPRVDGLGATYPSLGLVLAVVWWASLQSHQSRSPLVVGHGPAVMPSAINGTVAGVGVPELPPARTKPEAENE